MTFDMSKAWNEAMAMISANKEVLAVVSGIFFFLPTVLAGLLQPDAGLEAVMQTDDMDATQAAMLQMFSDYWWLFGLTILLQMIGYVALIALLGRSGRPTVGEAISAGLVGMIPAILAYAILIFAFSILAGTVLAMTIASKIPLLIALAVLATLFSGIFVTMRTILFLPAIAIDQEMNPIKTLVRSWHLTKGSALYLFAFFALLTVALVVISLVAQLLAMGVGALLGEDGALLVVSIVGAVIGSAGAAVTAAVLTAAYRQLAGPPAGEAAQAFD